MADSWFSLSREDQADALAVAADRLGRPEHLLEKDVWVVWTLSSLYRSPLAESLTFKGGTSLSKVYGVISRFSEDIDLTYDIRKLVPDLLKEGDPIPATQSQQKKITGAIRDRLPGWIEGAVKPVIQSALEANGLTATLTITGDLNDKLILDYPEVKTGTGYAATTVLLEFGARATGEPHNFHDVGCDMAPVLDGVLFPSARPLVMAVERTFWEKATAAHVFCLQGRLRGERYSRHWFDLAAISQSAHYHSAAGDSALAQAVAEHKSMYFPEKDPQGSKIDYFAATSGQLRLIPEGESLVALEQDYAAMVADGLLPSDQPGFESIIERCRIIQDEINNRT